MPKVKSTKYDFLKKNHDVITTDPYNFANKISIKELVNLLKTLSDIYYNEELPDQMYRNIDVSDEIYDILKDVLEKRDPSNKFLKEIGAQVISKEAVKLPYYMSSLDKIKPDTDSLNKWINKYPGPYVISDKLDGVSGLFVKRDDTFKLYTRGNGYEGQDITHLITYVIPKNINKDFVKDFAIRGELIISKQNFKKIEKDYKNARNAVAGLVNSKHYSEQVAAVTDFIAYSVISPKLSIVDQMKTLERIKFPMVNYHVEKQLTNDKLSTYLSKRRNDGLYEIDGLVVTDSSKIYDIPENNPEYAFAFKMVLTDQIAEVKVLDVEWNCSKHGYLKPTIRVEPVKLVGVTVESATAFNAKFVVDNVLGPGAIVKLVRSGDVIPDIMEVIKPAASGTPKLPEIAYKWTDTNVDIIVKDIHGACKDEIIIKKLTFFFKTLGVKYLSEGIITKLVNNGYDSVFEILQADKEELYEIDGLGQTIIEKIYTNIFSAIKKLTLPKLMTASCIFGRNLGETRLKEIVNTYPNIMNEKWTLKLMKEKIIEIDGFSNITAAAFTDNITEFKKFYAKLADIVDLKHLEYKKQDTKNMNVNNKNNIFDSMKIVFTGFRNKELQDFIESNGGKVSTSVSKNTNLVVYTETSSSKYTKAVNLGVPVMTLNEFKKKYNK